VHISENKDISMYIYISVYNNNNNNNNNNNMNNSGNKRCLKNYKAITQHIYEY